MAEAENTSKQLMKMTNLPNREDACKIIEVYLEKAAVILSESAANIRYQLKTYNGIKKEVEEWNAEHQAAEVSFLKSVDRIRNWHKQMVHETKEISIRIGKQELKSWSSKNVDKWLADSHYNEICGLGLSGRDLISIVEKDNYVPRPCRSIREKFINLREDLAEDIVELCEEFSMDQKHVDEWKLFFQTFTQKLEAFKQDMDNNHAMYQTLMEKVSGLIKVVQAWTEVIKNKLLASMEILREYVYHIARYGAMAGAIVGGAALVGATAALLVSNAPTACAFMWQSGVTITIQTAANLAALPPGICSLASMTGQGACYLGSATATGAMNVALATPGAIASALSAFGTAAVAAGGVASSVAAATATGTAAAASAAPGAVAGAAVASAEAAAVLAPLLAEGGLTFAAVAPGIAIKLASALAAMGVSTSLIYGAGVAVVKLANCIVTAAKAFDEAIGLSAKLEAAKMWTTTRVSECQEIASKLGSLTAEALASKKELKSPRQVQSKIKNMLKDLDYTLKQNTSSWTTEKIEQTEKIILGQKWYKEMEDNKASVNLHLQVAKALKGYKPLKGVTLALEKEKAPIDDLD